MNPYSEKFSKHVQTKRECVCGRVFHGNGYFNHKRWCENERRIWNGVMGKVIFPVDGKAIGSLDA